MKIHSDAIGLILVLLVRDSLASWLWFGISSVSTVAPQNVTRCNSVPGLTSQQLSFCQNKPNLIPSVSHGAVLAIEECQRVFRKERWNCSTVNAPSVFGGVLQVGSKETAFVHAITSAALVHSVTKSCSSGNLSECTCEGRRGVSRRVSSRIRWEWNGCNDDVNYGVWLSKNFADPVVDGRHLSRKKTGRIAMNIHNNAVGRTAVRKLMKKQCRCHGVSQSCAIRTCWKSVPKFEEVGDYLKYKYDRAVWVSFNRRKQKLRRKEQKKLKLEATDLVYVESSPNYCDNNPQMGIPGTLGRVCNKTSSDMDSCSLLCCGKGHNTEVVREVRHCSCKLVSCCRLECHTCEGMYDRHTCK